MKELLQALRAAGASEVERWALGGISYCLSRGNPRWFHTFPRAKGAWGVSIDVHGDVPDDLLGQATQALDIYRTRDLGSWVDPTRPARSIAELAVRWWRPSISADEMQRRRARRQQSCAAEWVANHPLMREQAQVERAAAGFPMGLVVALGLVALLVGLLHS